MESAIDESPRVLAATYSNVVCVGCGCHCDDLTVTSDPARGWNADVDCPIAQQQFSDLAQRSISPVIRVRGRETTLDEACEESARILHTARYPAIVGIETLSVEAQRAALGLTRRMRGVLLSSRSEGTHRGLLAHGFVTATLGEVRSRADLVVIWDSDPAVTHPRHFERYSLDPVSRFLPNGRADRRVISLESAPRSSSDFADRTLRFRPGADLALATSLEAMVRGLPLDAGDVEAATGVPMDDLHEIVESFRMARYGVILHDASSASDSAAEHAVRGVCGLVRQLNEIGSHAYVPLGGGQNPEGAAEVLAWTAARSGSVDFSRREAMETPFESLAEMLKRRAVDAVLLVGVDPIAELEPNEWQWLGQIPTITLSTSTTATSESSTVCFPNTALGWDSAGTVFRSDGVCLPLTAMIDKEVFESVDILSRIDHHLAQLNEKQSPWP